MSNKVIGKVSPLTTKGDIETFSTVLARLGVGSDGQLLSADSTQTTGLKWVTSSSAPLNQFNMNVGDASNTTQQVNTSLIGDSKASAAVSATVTVTIATPAVFSLTAHGFFTGDKVYFTTTGALPTGLTASTTYYVIKIDANSFSVATTQANCFAVTKVATSGTQSGTHSVFSGGLKLNFPSTLSKTQAWTPTVTGFGTISSVVASYYRVGDRIRGQFSFVSGVSTAVPCSVSLPTGLTTATTYDASIRTAVGVFNQSNQLSHAGTLSVQSGQIVMSFSIFGDANAVSNGSDIVVNTQRVSGYFDIAIAEWAY